MTSSALSEPHTDLKPGQIVVLKSNPAIRGVIVEVLPGEPEPRYQVFVDGGTQTFYASQVTAETKGEENFQCLSRRWFHGYLTAL